MIFEWNDINKESVRYTQRAKTMGGWLVRTFIYGNHDCIAICFVPDPNHEWEIDEE